MKKRYVPILFLVLTLIILLPLVSAQTYSGFNRFIDNVKMFFASGDNKVKLALEIREKEIDSAIINSQSQNEKDAIKNLERAHKRLQFINGKISLDVVDEVKESVDEVVSKIEDEEDLSDNFDVYVLEEKKTKLTGELIESTYEYCKELTEEDFALMLKEEECNPETAPEPIKKDLEKLIDLQLRMFVQLMLEIRSCVDDPGTCNCEANVDVEQKAKCEKMVALAMKCEYNNDETSCDELESMRPTRGDGFAESFVPDFLMNLFREKSYMIEYGIEPSCGVPEECWDENDKPECEQYDHLKETNDDWDEYGNFIGTKNDCGNEGLTMQESIPECFDGDIFLEEKCGEITLIEDEEGLINYIIEKEREKGINEFENKSAQHTIDANGSLGQAVWEIKEGIMEVEDDIQGWVVDHAVMDVDGDDGLTWDIKTGGDGDGSGGDAGVVIDGDNQGVVTDDGGDNVVDNDVAGDGDGGYAPGTTAGGAPSDSSGGDCGEGVECGGEGDVIDSPAGDNVIDNGATLDDTDASDDPVESGGDSEGSGS